MHAPNFHSTTYCCTEEVQYEPKHSVFLLPILAAAVVYFPSGVLQNTNNEDGGMHNIPHLIEST